MKKFRVSVYPADGGIPFYVLIIALDKMDARTQAQSMHPGAQIGVIVEL